MKRIEIPTGTIRIHLYSFRNVLRPRGGTMEKESLGLDIYERLQGAYEEWTNPKYGDNPEASEVLKQIRKNLMEEVETAWNKFTNEVKMEDR